MRRQPQASRFEATLDGHFVAVAQYERTGNQITFTHTIVAEAAEGHGVGGKLVKFALDQARAKGSPWCRNARSSRATCDATRSTETWCADVQLSNFAQ